MLEESQLNTRELAQQDEDLRQINNELVTQSGKLKLSESELRKQQDILKRVNSELENKALLLEEKNMAVEDAHKALAFKAEQLERSSKYKSDFLANMSHELRTPLNSVLILAKLLEENRPGNMTTKQVEHAKVIHKSGSDLLVIINDILDLSKIEAGKLELIKEETSIHEICENMEQLFSEVSKAKQIEFLCKIDISLPEFMNTDRIRVEQILKNLLSNAFKFTPAGGTVTLEANTASGNTAYKNEKLLTAESIICFSVTDSGIGIPEEKQKLIFEAFNQADSSTTRKYGGTGLGLTICRQLVSLLGGDIIVESEAGAGSVFKLFLPIGQISKESKQLQSSTTSYQEINTAGEILVICADGNIVDEWSKLFALENYHVIGSDSYETEFLDNAPAIVIIDATLSDKEYVEKILKLKANLFLSNSFIICRSVSEYIPAEIKDLVMLHTTSPVNAKVVSEILNVIHSPVKALNYQIQLEQNTAIPFTKKVFNIPTSVLASARLEGKRILVADDDIRNIYSMTTIFENEGAEVLCAMDGMEAIEKLNLHKNIDLIIMDIMMPNMDGLQAIQEIRKMDFLGNLPIIAVTAKAMRGDREICMNAGATEYITKPVNIELLLTKVFQLLENKES
ncbi:MAG: response regulator [Bacteroidetes bacterium]|nr:response regulator [Bacteroidota bacterium]